MKKLQLFKTMLLLCALVVGSGTMWGETVTLTSAQIKAGTGSTSYGSCSATDGGGNTWNAYAIKNQHSKATSDYHYWQIKKYASSTAYYVQVPTLGNKITKLEITVSGSSQARDGGGNSATLYFSSSSSTSDTGSGVVSGTGASSVTIDCSSLDLNSGYITAGGAVRIWDVVVTYSGKPDAPSFDVAGGEFNAAFDLTISSATGTTLKYTTDGTDPASSGTATSVATNSAVVSIPAATTRVRAIAIKGGVNSNETDVTYTYSSKEEPTLTLSPSPLNLKVGANGTLTLTTNSDGDVTFSCDDAHVSLSGTGNSRTVSADAAGSYTIDVSIDASATYMSKAGSVTLNVTKYDTSVAIDASGITVTNLKNGTAAGTVTASVTYGEPTSAVPESSVTWSSTKTSVATVNATTGVITLVGVGNTTIKATYAGNDTYNGSNSTYALTVTDTRTSFEWDLSTNSYSSAGEESVTWSDTKATMVVDKASSGTAANNYLGGDANSRTSSRFYQNSTLTITPASNYCINSVEFTATSDSYATALANSSWTNASAASSGTKVTVTPTVGTSAFYATIGGTCGFTKVKVYYDELATITLNAACKKGSKYFGTYSNSKAFIVPEGLTVSCVGIDGEELEVSSYSTGDIVKAGIGVLVSATSAGDKTIYLTTETGTELSGNLLKPSGDSGISSSDMDEDDTSFYRLTMHNGTQIGFWYGADGGAAFDLGANKAYLAVPDAVGARVLGYAFDDEGTTGIESIANSKQPTANGQYFDLQGRRVAQPTKGLYIVNGKKVIIK